MTETPPLLVEQYPELALRLPFQALVARPTPVEPLAGLAGAQLYVKRDDLTSPLYGGNKARKFEFLLGQGKAGGCRELWTLGGLCSNHCTAAAVHGAAVGLRVRLYYAVTPLDAEEAELLQLQAMLGAEQRMVSSVQSAREWAFCRDGGVLVVPPGGSSPEGVMGYVDAGLELAGQVERGEAPKPDVLYISAASMGTVMGLCMGLRLGGLETRVVAVETVDRRWQLSRVLLPSVARAHRMLRDASTRLREALPGLAALRPVRDHRYDGIPLGAADGRVEQAMQRAWEGWGLRLDAHFSGKGFAALCQDLEAGALQGRTVLFWQTHGQVPEAMLAKARASATPLPPEVARAVARNLRV